MVMVMMVTYLDESKENTKFQKGLIMDPPSSVFAFFLPPQLTDDNLALWFLLADSFSEPSLIAAPEDLTRPPRGMGSSC